MFWLRLIRWNNLLIILLTQLLAWWCVIVPLKRYTGLTERYTGTPLLLTPLNFSLICLSTMLIAAAGYIINDYFDIRIDAINKPDEVILERQIPRRMAIIVHSVLNIIALIFAGIVAWQAYHLEYMLLQATCTLLLWQYSTTWKRQFMTGNLIVALLTMLTIITLILYEPAVKGYLASPFIIKSPVYGSMINPAYVLYFFCFFAFILTWIREIVKDMEDYKGDAEEGCITMPIQWGLKKTISFTRVLGMIALAGILLSALFMLYVDMATHHRWLLTIYLCFLFAAIAAWLFFIGKQLTTAHFHKASRYLKIIMVLGIGSLLLYRFQYA